jgi:hypothetical protein
VGVPDYLAKSNQPLYNPTIKLRVKIIMKTNESKIRRTLSLRRFFQWLTKYQWQIVIGLIIVAVYLGYIGFLNHFQSIGEIRSHWDYLYLSIQLFVLQSGDVPAPKSWHLEVARLLAPTLATYTAIKALMVILKEQVQSFYLWFMKDHFVIFGMGRKGSILVEGFKKCGYRTVVIEKDENNSYLGQCKEQGSIVITGNATHPAVLRNARVDKARYLFTVTGDDGANAEIAVHARDMVKDRKGRVLTCFVHIMDPQLCNLLMEHEMFIEKSEAFRLEFFNIYDKGARALLQNYPAFSKEDENKSSQPHIVVVGLGSMGKSLVVHAARNWKSIFKKSGRQLSVTIIDRQAMRKTDLLCLQYPQLKNVCSLNPQQIDIHWPEFHEAKFLFDSKGQCNVKIIYICLGDSSLGLSAALTLYEKLKGQRIPIVVRVIQDEGFAVLSRELKFENVYPFALLDETCKPREILSGMNELIARALHEEYVRQQKSFGHTPQTKPAISSWNELEEQYKESNRRQAYHVGVKLRAIGCGVTLLTDWDAELIKFTPLEVETMAEIEHIRWKKVMEDAGWKYGPIRDDDKKIHPSMIPWEELTEADKEINRNFIRKLPHILAQVDLQIYRLQSS